MKVEMRFPGIACIPDLPDRLSCFNACANLHRNIGPQVSVIAELILPMIDDNEVSAGIFRINRSRNIFRDVCADRRNNTTFYGDRSEERRVGKECRSRWSTEQ